MKKWVLLLAVGLMHHAFAETAGERLQSKLNALGAMTADFNQKVTVKKKSVSSSSGTMALQRPGKFRWKTIEPLEQLIVADGQKVWVYDVELEQVSVKKQEKGLGGTAALFLSGYDDKVTNDFEVTEKTKGKTSVFTLKAKTGRDNFQRIELIFNDNQLSALELYDQLGQVTYVKLSHIQVSKSLANSLFQFKPPKGVDIIRQ